jgi:hypothetical protein
VKSDAGRTRERGKDARSCQCPFCDAPVEETLPFCKACGRATRRCPTCGRVLQVNEAKCPQCK